MIWVDLTAAHRFQPCIILNDKFSDLQRSCRLLPFLLVIIFIPLTSAGQRKRSCLLDSLRVWLFEFLGRRCAIVVDTPVRGSVVAFPFLASQNLMMAVLFHSKLWLGCPRYLIKSNYA